MKARPPIYFQGSGKRSPRGFKSFLYALLSVALLGGLFWLWRHNAKPVELVARPAVAAVPAKPVERPAALPIPAPIRSNPPPVVVRPMIPPQTNAVTESGSRPVETVLETQIALVRLGLSPGSIDGVSGGQTGSALAAFQRRQNLSVTGVLDNETKAALSITLPATTNYAITSNDLARLMPMPKTWVEKSRQTRLDYETITELLGEKSFSSPHLVERLNPNIDWTHVTPGTVVTLPLVAYPAVTGQAAMVRISLHDRVLEAFDSESNLMVHFPCSIGHIAAKRPAGELHVTVIAPNPNYTFNPAVFPESPEAQAIGHKLIIPPGPNNPVGVAWIGLDRPGYGMHGTPGPEQVGRTESHGCFRLANWNADYLSKIVWIGMPVFVEQ